MFFDDGSYGFSPMGYYDRRPNQYARRGHPSGFYGGQPDFPYGYQPQRQPQHKQQRQPRRAPPQESTEPHFTRAAHSRPQQIPVKFRSPTHSHQQPEVREENVNYQKSELEGAELSTSPKQYSVASTTTLSTLDKVSEDFSALVSAIDTIEKNTEETDVESVLDAKHKLAQYAGDIDKLQFNKLDAIQTAELKSGKEKAKSQRRGLNHSLDELQRRVQEMYRKFSDLASELAVPPSPASGASSENDSESASSEDGSDRESEEESEEEGDSEECVQVSVEDPLGMMVTEEEGEGEEEQVSSPSNGASENHIEEDWEEVQSATSPCEQEHHLSEDAPSSATDETAESGVMEQEEDDVTTLRKSLEDKETEIKYLKSMISSKDKLIAHLMSQLKEVRGNQ